MTSPRLATTHEWGREYARKRGGAPTVPSITTILDCMSRDLEWWEALCAVNEAMKYADLLVQIDQMPNGRPMWDRRRAAKDWLMEAAVRDRNAASVRGDLVHDYAEALALRDLGRDNGDVTRTLKRCEDGGVMPYVENVRNFWATWKLEPVQPEATLWSKPGRYAGTTDLFAYVNTPHGRTLAIIDWKTKKSLYKRNGQAKNSDLKLETGMQLAAAARAEEIWVPSENSANDRWEPNPHLPLIGLAVAFAPDGYTVRQYDIHHPLVWSTFMALRTAYDFKHGKVPLMGPRISAPEKIIELTPPPDDLVATRASLATVLH